MCKLKKKKKKKRQCDSQAKTEIFIVLYALISQIHVVLLLSRIWCHLQFQWCYSRRKCGDFLPSCFSETTFVHSLCVQYQRDMKTRWAAFTLGGYSVCSSISWAIKTWKPAIISEVTILLLLFLCLKSLIMQLSATLNMKGSFSWITFCIHTVTQHWYM